MISRLVVLVGLALAFPPAPWAQQRPNLSGTWQLDTSEPAGYTGAAGSNTLFPESSTGRAWGAHARTLVIKHTATEVTVESTHFGNNERRQFVYKLDGSDTETPDPKRPDIDGLRWLTRGRWEGDTLALYTYHGWNQMVDRLSLTGGQLTIRRELSGQTGGSTAAAGPHRLVYSMGR
jgi:hypothetical protein